MAKAFLQPRDGLLLVDSLNFCFRYRNRKGAFSADFIRDIRSFSTSFNCREVIILGDRYGSKYRKDIYPDYKGNRKKKDQTPEEKDQFTEFINEYNHTLEVAKECFKVVVIEGIEADDTISWFCLNKHRDFSDITILSTDKDLDQLVTPKVKRFSYVTRKETNAENFEETVGVIPSEFLLLKCLQGDSGDNIPGVAGIGGKRGAVIAREYCELELILDAMPLDGKQKFITNLNASRDLLLLNDKLMNLLDYHGDIFTQEQINYINEVYNATN